MPFTEQPLEAFMADLASSTPAPGGGSVAALAGALGASLVSMVANLTVGKEKYKAAEPQAKEMLAKADELRLLLLRLLEDDVAAFNGYSAAAKLPKDTDEQKAARSAAIQKALVSAAAVPLDICRACVEVLDLARPMAEIGNVQALSDAGVAALMAEAGLRSAALNVEINLGWIKDVDFVARTRADLNALLDGRAEQKEETVAYVRSKL